MSSSASFVIVLHQVWKKHPLHKDFLGLYTLESHKLSAQPQGLLGMNSFNIVNVLSFLEAAWFADTTLYLAFLNWERGENWGYVDWPY